MNIESETMMAKELGMVSRPVFQPLFSLEDRRCRNAGPNWLSAGVNYNVITKLCVHSFEMFLLLCSVALIYDFSLPLFNTVNCQPKPEPIYVGLFVVRAGLN